MNSFKTYNSPYENPERASQMLNNIRTGQPTPELMYQMSGLIPLVIDYLSNEFSRKNSTIKLIVGEMGEGKSTLSQIIKKIADDSGCSPVINQMPHLKSLSVLSTISQMIAHESLYVDCFKKIRKFSEEDNKEAIDKILSSLKTHRFGALLEHLVFILSASSSSDAFIHSISGKLSNAISTWLISGKTTPLSEVIAETGGQKIIIGAPSKSEALDLFSLHLAFYRACDVNPVWMIDEFESMCGMMSNAKADYLGLVRDVIDEIAKSKGGAGGNLFIFTTGDGLGEIRRYPALNDRLQGSRDFLLSSPTWNVTAFSEWDPVNVINEIRYLYIDSAEAGDFISRRVKEEMDDPKVVEEYTRVANIILSDTSTPPRLKLKGMVMMMDNLSISKGQFFKAAGQIKVEKSDLCMPPHEEANSDDRLFFDDLNDDSGYEAEREVNNTEECVLEIVNDVPSGSIDAEKIRLPYSKRRRLSTSAAERAILRAKTSQTLASAISAYRDTGGLVRSIASKLPRGYKLMEDMGAIDLWSEGVEALDVLRSVNEKVDFMVSRLVGADGQFDGTAEIDESDENDERDAGITKKEWVVVKSHINPLSSLGELRHYFYSYFASQKKIPGDAWVDALTLDALKKIKGYKPHTSRYGIQFIAPSIVGLWEKRINYADEAI